MQIILDQNEIEQAIDAYVRSQISINDDQEVAIELKAGRGDNGFSATLDIRQAQPKTVPKKTTRRVGIPASHDEGTPAVTPAEPALTRGILDASSRSISATPEDRQPEPAPEPTKPAASFFSPKPAEADVEEATQTEPLPVAKAPSIFNFPKATAENEVA